MRGPITTVVRRHSHRRTNSFITIPLGQSDCLSERIIRQVDYRQAFDSASEQLMVREALYPSSHNSNLMILPATWGCAEHISFDIAHDQKIHKQIRITQLLVSPKDRHQNVRIALFRWPSYGVV